MITTRSPFCGDRGRRFIVLFAWNSATLLTYQQSKFNRYHCSKHFSELALPTRWRRKPAGTDMERNHVTVFLCIIVPNVEAAIFTARCYASAEPAMALCPSVCPSVCPSQVGVLQKRLHGGSRKQHHTIVQGLSFSDAKDLREIRPGSPPTRAPNAGGVGQHRRLSTNSWLYLEDGTR